LERVCASPCLPGRASVPREPRVPQKLQPVGVRLTRQEDTGYALSTGRNRESEMPASPRSRPPKACANTQIPWLSQPRVPDQTYDQTYGHQTYGPRPCQHFCPRPRSFVILNLRSLERFSLGEPTGHTPHELFAWEYWTKRKLPPYPRRCLLVSGGSVCQCFS